MSDNSIRAGAVRNGLRLCLRNKLEGLAVLDERRHFMDLMMDAFKTQGQTSLQSHIGEIKMMEAAPYSTLVKELWEHPEQHKKKKNKDILVLIFQVRPLTDLF